MQNNATNTCRTCYYFNNKPRLVSGEKMPAGCCLLIELVTSLEPETNHVITSRPVIASDSACDEHVIEQEFLLRQASTCAMTNAQPIRAAMKSKFIVIQGGKQELV